MKCKTTRKKGTSLAKSASDINLPGNYAWKVLSCLVDDLSYLLTLDELEKLKIIIRNKDHDAYLLLEGEWGLQSKHLIHEQPARVRAVYQVTTLLKKYIFEGSQIDRREAAKKKFFAAEETCREYNQSGFTQFSFAKTEKDARIFTLAQSFLAKLLGVSLPDRQVMTHWSRHGPGSNLDTDKSNVSAYHKHENWPYSCTQAAFLEARFAIEDDERWLGALEDDYRKRFNIPKHFILDRQVFWANVINIVDGNRITFVPKSALTERTIAIEPAMNLYLQLGVDGYIRRRLKRWGVDIDDQTKNQKLARLGSSTGEFATLDLAAASDTISTKVCEKLLPSSWYNHLLKLRSPVGSLDDEKVSYEKISSMGNGFTFALETAIFTALVYAVQIESKGQYNPERCAVYGDDLIVPTNEAARVVEVLNLAGFAINHEKSFFEGPFRESCGADWFQGRAIRPILLKADPNSVMSLWVDINRLKRHLALRFDIQESQTIAKMVTWIPDKFRGCVGPLSDENFDSYLHISNAPTGQWKNCRYVFRRLIVQPIEQKRCKSFFFKKLMHPLRQIGSHRWSDPTWRGAIITASGSSFTVTRRNGVRVRHKYSTTSDWRSKYKDLHLVDYQNCCN